MSGPIVPPLTVSDVADGGAVTGRPITTLEVTNGTLSVSGRTATLTTGGGGGGGGVTSIATTGPISGGTITTTGTISIDQSDSTTDGYLSSTDWNVFNSKGSGDGDVVGPGSAVNEQIVIFDGTTGKLIKDGGKVLPASVIVGTSDGQTLTNKTINFAFNTGTNYEGVDIASTGEAGATKFLREDGAGGSSWETPAGGGSMSSFNVAGDTGATQTITDGNTLTIKNAAGGAIKTVGVATDELTIDLTVSGVSAGSYTNTDLTVDNQGRITAASSGSGGGSGTVTSVAGTGTSGITITGGPITTSGTLTVDLDDTLVTPGTYGDDTNVAQLTIDQQGRITAAADVAISAGAGTVTSITAAADSGSGTAITTSGTFTFTGSTGITTSVSGTTVTIAADNNGDVTKVGTPVDNEVVVWTGDGTVEGDTNFQWDGADLYVDNLKIGANTIASRDTNGDISLTPDGTGAVEISSAYKLPTAVTAANDYVLTAQDDGSTAWAAAGGGGSGTITGSIADTQVAFGDTTADSIQGTSAFTYDDTNKILSISNGVGTPTLQSGSADLILRNSTVSAHSKITLGYNASNSDITLETDGTGLVGIHNEGALAYTLPNASPGVNDYVLTGQTDGSTAWAAAGGGGGSTFSPILNMAGAASTGSHMWTHHCAPYGVMRNTTSSFSTDEPQFYPFVCPDTLTVDTSTAYGGNIQIQSASTGNMLIGLYDTNSVGGPNDLQLEATADTTSTGGIYYQWSVATGGSASFITAGSQIWIGFVMEDAGDSVTYYSSDGEYAAGWAVLANAYNTEASLIYDYSGSDNALPATVTPGGGLAYANGLNMPALSFRPEP